jgi:hypothetical protein
MLVSVESSLARSQMPTSADQPAPDRELLWGRAEQTAERFLDETDRVIFDAIELAEAHQTALKSGVPAESSTSQELFAEMGDDIDAAREHAVYVIRALWGRIST